MSRLNRRKDVSGSFSGCLVYSVSRAPSPQTWYPEGIRIAVSISLHSAALSERMSMSETGCHSLVRCFGFDPGLRLIPRGDEEAEAAWAHPGRRPAT